MKTFVLFLVTASLSSSALAQSPPRLDPSATNQPVAVVSTRHVSRGARLVRDTLIGAGAGALTGWLLWEAAHDRECPTCGESREHAVLTTGLFGATAGAWIGIVQGWGAGRHPDVRVGPHLTLAPAVSRSRAGGVVRVAF